MTTFQPDSKELRNIILTCQRCPLSQSVTPVPFYPPKLKEDPEPTYTTHATSTGLTYLDNSREAPEISEMGSGTGQSGPNSALFLGVLGEAPGRVEDHRGRPFMGQAGKLLRSYLQELRFDPNQCFWFNTVSCWPKGAPEKGHKDACKIHLRSQLHIAPVVVLVCGGVALEALAPHAKLKHAVGNVIPLHNKFLVPIYHPAFILKNWDMRFKWKEQIEVALNVMKRPLSRSHMQGRLSCIYCGEFRGEVPIPTCKKKLCRTNWRLDQQLRVPKIREPFQHQLFPEEA